MMAPMRWRRGLAVAASAATIAALVAGCSWRLDTPDEPFRTPSPVTLLRDDVAASESALAAAASTTDGDFAAAEAVAAPLRLDALGGVSPTSSPRPSTDIEVALNGAIASAHQCVAGAGEDPLGGLCASIELSHWAIAAASGTSMQTTIAPDAGLTPAGSTGVHPATLSQLALEHDKARALYEVIAARATGSERTDALTRSAEHRARVAALLALPGVEDLTEPAYDVPAASMANKAARTKAALATEVALAQAYAALMVSAAPDDRSWLANAALAAYEAAVAHGLTPADVPALPGVASDG